MSLASKITLIFSCVAAGGTIIYVCARQRLDKENMRRGILLDIDRQQKKKIENLYWLEKQVEMTKFLKKQTMEDDKVALKLLENDKKGEY